MLPIAKLTKSLYKSGCSTNNDETYFPTRNNSSEVESVLISVKTISVSFSLIKDKIILFASSFVIVLLYFSLQYFINSAKILFCLFEQESISSLM